MTRITSQNLWYNTEIFTVFVNCKATISTSTIEKILKYIALTKYLQNIPWTYPLSLNQTGKLIKISMIQNAM